MAKTLKTWTAIGVAVMGMGATADAAALHALQPFSNPSLVLVDGEGGEAAASESSESAGPSFALQSTDANAYTYDGKPVVEAYAALVLKSYEQAQISAQSLQAAVNALLEQPNAQTLNAARLAWVAARPAYMRTEAFRFYEGPIDRVEAEINSWPLNEAFIDYVEGAPSSGIVNDGKTKLDKETLEGLNQKDDEKNVTIGWHAIEFLLWGQDFSSTGPGNRPYTDYVAGSPANDRRRAYLKFVTDQLEAELDGVKDQWKLDNEKGYARKFLTMEPREAIGRMVNGMAILAGYEFMSERLGVALDSGDQEDEQSCFSDTTKQDFIADLAGIKQVWSETGLDKLVAGRDAAIAAKVTEQLAATETQIAALGDPWDQVLAAAPETPPRKDAEVLVTQLQSLADALKAAGNKLGVLVLIPSE